MKGRYMMNEEKILEGTEIVDSGSQTVDASPTKGFFIYMITRDIYIRPAIVELIDNASLKNPSV